MKKVIVKTSLIAIGFLVGLIAAWGANAACGRINKNADLMLFPLDDEGLRSVLPKENFYVLKSRHSEEYAVVSIDPGVGFNDITIYGKIEGRTRAISISSKEGRFPGQITVDHYEDDPYMSVHCIVDSNADGTPDRRVDWKTNTFFVLADIQWVPTSQPEIVPQSSMPSQPGS